MLVRGSAISTPIPVASANDRCDWKEYLVTIQNCALIAALMLCCAIGNAAILPTDKPSMTVKVEAGEYTVLGRIVNVPAAAEVKIDTPEKITVKAEEQVLVDEKPQAYGKGTALKLTLGPVDTFTRLAGRIDPESVKVHSTPDGGTIYTEGKDYLLDHDWGGMCRVETGSIARGAKVYVDYSVHNMRIDTIQVANDGKVSVKKGASAPVNVEAPAPDKDCTAIAHVYVPYRTTAITQQNIYPLPSKNIIWQDFARVSGRQYLSNTLSLLKANKPVTVVCWGDSVTQGGSPSSHDKCYVEVFRARLKAAYPKADITLINAGIGGSNTNSRRDGFEKEVLALNPDLITVEFVNDSGMPADMIKRNWDEFIARARKKNPKVEFILITPHHIMPEWMGNFAVSVPAMRHAAQDNQVALADSAYIWDNLRALGIPYESLEANGINHPNDLGHDFFATSLMKLMSPE